MKISGIEVFHTPGWRKKWVFLKLHTDEGITGIGQVASGQESAMVAAATRNLEQWLLGEDPAYIERMWVKLYKLFTGLGSRGFASALISGVDIALWDIRGKQLGLPVYQLLGGSFRDSLVLYANINRLCARFTTPEEYADLARKTVAQGYEALKLDPYMRFLGSKPRQHGGGISPQGEAQGAEIVAAIREAVGHDVEILIDAHGNFDVPTAIRLANSLAPYSITWFEEPVPPESYEALKQVRERVSVPICVGERLFTRYDFTPILEQRLSDYLMPDVIRTGGISELKKIAIMAEARFVPLSPHDATGPLNIIAGAQTMMTVPNFYRLELALSELELYNQALDPPLDIRGGTLFLPDRPGLGFELREDFLQKCERFE